MLLRFPGVELAAFAGVLGLTGRVVVRLSGATVDALPRDVPGLTEALLGALAGVLLGVLAGVLGLAVVVELAVLGRSLRLSPQDWINFIQSGALPSLRTLHATPGTNEPPFSFWEPLRTQSIAEACHTREIAFVSS